MHIDFHIKHGIVSDASLQQMRDRLLTLHRKDREIAKANVVLREEMADPLGRVCEVELLIYGSSIYVHRQAWSYDCAFREVMEMLTETIDAQLRKQKEPRVLNVTTVRV
ncbi:MAG: hypothetical protein P0Y53_12305 [Candidatus Pseudobacter hemicellulosilyticus]|uniref:HPF/RaiA family ribosome-associated protein n=1 Tax=Candidatus Pseudobacter hemicellulosilyticus TaxID=3121375 RepID=A0AAJ5WW48_9BACT|nr:MAG: hypothetical protein P0Y53_12305 [Pseudobacter sp.]